MVENESPGVLHGHEGRTGSKELKKKSCEEKEVAVHIICPGSMKYPRKEKMEESKNQTD